MAAPLLQAGLAGEMPRTPQERLTGLCQPAWGIEGRFTRLPSVCDELFRIDADDGQSYVLRLTSPLEDPLATDFQTQALAHLSRSDATLPVPRLVPTLEGELAFRPAWWGEPAPTARLFQWLEGVPLVQVEKPDGRSMGLMLARIGLALADFDHPGADHDHDWDLRNAGRLAPLLTEIGDSARRTLTERAMARFVEETAPRLASLRRQVVHNDFNLHNVLVGPNAPSVITGVIDFGDMVRTALIADVAIAAAYILRGDDDPFAIIRPFLAAYHALRPLEEREVALLVPLIEARHLATVAITEWRAARNPEDSASITKNTERAWGGLELLSRTSRDRLTEELLRVHATAGGDDA